MCIINTYGEKVIRQKCTSGLDCFNENIMIDDWGSMLI